MNNRNRYSPQEIILPWVELELLDLDPKFNFDASVDINSSPFIDVRSLVMNEYADFIASIASLYKRMKPIFRTVANAICTYELDTSKLGFPVARHLRPFEQDKARVCSALARYLDSYRRTSGNNFGCFKSPLKVLVEMAYGLNNTFSEDEIAVLFNLLVEAMGIRTQFVLSEAETGQRRLDVACQTVTISLLDEDVDEKDIQYYSFYSFNSQRHILKNSFNYIGSYKLFDTLELELKIQNLPIREVVVRRLVTNYVGTGDRSQTRYWNNRMLTKEAAESEWFGLLESARYTFEKNDYPYLSSVFSRQRGVVIGENFGPQATASIMAWIANSMVTYKEVFLTFLRDSVVQPNLAFQYSDLKELMSAVDGDVDSMKKLLSRLFYYCRAVFPYSEETIGVEQVASPLKILFIHAFQPYIQRYDCDDLTLLFMSFVECLGSEPAVKEAMGLKSMVRLAGAPDSGDIKFHVYPVVKFDRVDSSEYTHDVSAPTDLLYWQMNHGGNKEDYIPTVQSSYIPILSKLGRRGMVAGNRIINL